MKRLLMILIAILMFGCDIDNNKISGDFTDFTATKPDTFSYNRYQQYKYNAEGERINGVSLIRNGSIYIDEFKIRIKADKNYFNMPIKRAKYLEGSELYLFHTTDNKYITFDPNMKTFKIEFGKNGTEFYINSTIKSNW